MSSRIEAAALADRISALGWRTLLAGCLLAGFAHMIATWQFATALVLGAALALAVLDLWRLFPRSGGMSAMRLADPMPDLSARLERALALLDAVTVALFVLDSDGRVRFTNHAARALAGFDVGRLRDVPLLGDGRADTILSLPLGGRHLMSLADGRSMLVWVGSISTPGAGVQRLISMQGVAGELDAVQVDAWHMMTRVLSHEMMNSLTPIASLSESVGVLVATDTQDKRIADAVATIGRRSRHLMRFVERYRAVVDLPDPELADIDLAAFLSDMDRLVGTELRLRGIDFAIEPVEWDRRVAADTALLEQAVLNLIRNAADAVAAVPEPRIRVTCVRRQAFMAISVGDNGMGISEDRLEDIFVPFFTTKADGAGIGLTLARQIALAHGGRLSARTAGDCGVVFELMLPDRLSG
jgi:two-component system nitrogen regulation sensor histidine kinase NtrY